MPRPRLPNRTHHADEVQLRARCPARAPRPRHDVNCKEGNVETHRWMASQPCTREDPECRGFASHRARPVSRQRRGPLRLLFARYSHPLCPTRNPDVYEIGLVVNSGMPTLSSPCSSPSTSSHDTRGGSRRKRVYRALDQSVHATNGCPPQSCAKRIGSVIAGNQLCRHSCQEGQLSGDRRQPRRRSARTRGDEPTAVDTRGIDHIDRHSGSRIDSNSRPWKQSQSIGDPVRSGGQ